MDRKPQTFDRCAICNMWTPRIRYIKNVPYCEKHATQKDLDRESLSQQKQHIRNQSLVQSAITTAPEYPDNEEINGL